LFLIRSLHHNGDRAAARIWELEQSHALLSVLAGLLACSNFPSDLRAEIVQTLTLLIGAGQMHNGQASVQAHFRFSLVVVRLLVIHCMVLFPSSQSEQVLVIQHVWALLEKLKPLGDAGGARYRLLTESACLYACIRDFHRVRIVSCSLRSEFDDQGSSLLKLSFARLILRVCMLLPDEQLLPAAVDGINVSQYVTYFCDNIFNHLSAQNCAAAELQALSATVLRVFVVLIDKTGRYPLLCFFCIAFRCNDSFFSPCFFFLLFQCFQLSWISTRQALSFSRPKHDFYSDCLLSIWIAKHFHLGVEVCGCSEQPSRRCV
jgi:hypothetical protein